MLLRKIFNPDPELNEKLVPIISSVFLLVKDNEFSFKYKSE